MKKTLQKEEEEEKEEESTQIQHCLAYYDLHGIYDRNPALVVSPNSFDVIIVDSTNS